MYRQKMEENRISKQVLYVNLETMHLRGRPRNGWQDEVREDGRLVGGKGWKEKVYNREEWKKLLRMARNCRILHMPMEWMNEWKLMKQLWAEAVKPRLSDLPTYWYYCYLLFCVCREPIWCRFCVHKPLKSHFAFKAMAYCYSLLTNCGPSGKA